MDLEEQDVLSVILKMDLSCLKEDALAKMELLGTITIFVDPVKMRDVINVLDMVSINVTNAQIAEM
jgi:hypothetical protein